MKALSDKGFPVGVSGVADVTTVEEWESRPQQRSPDRVFAHPTEAPWTRLTPRPNREDGLRPVPEIVTPASDPVQQARRSYSFDVAAWRTAAVRSPRLTTPTRLLLAIMADRMRTTDAIVSVPRAELAEYCGCSERQVSERLEEAVRERFLDRVSKGKRGHTAEYRGLRQTQSGRQSLTLSPAAEPRKREAGPDAFSETDTAQPPAFSERLSVRAVGKREAQPPTSKYAPEANAPRVLRGSSSALPSLQEVELTQEQRRDDGEPVQIGQVFELLFRRGAA